ncbi:MAG: GNAT family N-acetyltransferase [Palaeococcus sp.]|uniref:GNAT family N-acetyltransferase n=1 Tax=Palaeococcus sp. (in: euryarchaeotes) TaxID=2820298 RepID=UPI0025D2AEC9|nr:GNAT family protein [Palaeococcus sp. (in: euryarchaeotes)]MCD6558919.1 GNAT family N-acetyltransferase [Palaeococcus sp. (in: euryarchaeotes)]
MDEVEYKPFLEGKNIYLREVRVTDVNENYYKWMNDEEVTRFLESRFYPQAREKIEEYVRSINSNPNYIFLAIIEKKSDKHIGNIKLGPINWIHRHAEVGLIIGEKTAWGKGYATEAIKLVTDYAFKKLNLHKLTASCYKDNVGSQKAFKKNGYVVEGIRKAHCFYDGKYTDIILMGIINEC